MRLPPELRCPAHRLALAAGGRALLVCAQGCRVPVVGEIPRFVPGDGYAAAFGRQWRTYRRTQLDSETGTPISRTRLERCLGAPLASLRGRTVLEAGCGAGRFTELLLDAGARVFACDLSRAVEANRENCRQMAGALRLPGRHPRPARRGCRLRPRVVPRGHPAHAGPGGDDPRPGREGEAGRAAGDRPLRDAARGRRRAMRLLRQAFTPRRDPGLRVTPPLPSPPVAAGRGDMAAAFRWPPVLDYYDRHPSSGPRFADGRASTPTTRSPTTTARAAGDPRARPRGWPDRCRRGHARARRVLGRNQRHRPSRTAFERALSHRRSRRRGWSAGPRHARPCRRR